MIAFLLLGFMGFPGNLSIMLGGRLTAYWSMLSDGLLLISGLVSVVTLVDRYKTRKLPIELLLVLGFVILAFCGSALLSSSPPEALYLAIRFFCLIVLGLCIGIMYRLKRILQIVLAAHSALLLMYAFAFIVDQSVIFENGTYLVGLYSSKNNCAYELGFSLLACYGLILLCQSMRMRIALLLYSVLNVWLMMQTDCLGVVVVCIISLVVAELCRRSNLRPNLGSTFLCINVLFVLFVVGILPLMGSILADFGKDTTLTGRTYVWDILLSMISDSHTVLGYGYGMFWNHSPELAYWYQAEVRYGLGQYTGAHNLALELCLNVGLIGMSSFFALCFVGLNGSKLLNRPVYAFSLSYVLYYAVKGLVERTSNISYDLLFIFIVMGLVLAASSAVRERSYGVKTWQVENQAASEVFFKFANSGSNHHSGTDCLVVGDSDAINRSRPRHRRFSLVGNSWTGDKDAQ